MRMTSKILSGAVLLAAMGAATFSVGLATSASHTNTFNGRATTGPTMVAPGLSLPIDLVGSPTCFYGLGYVYRASGTARGSLPGSFTYEEHGCLLSDYGAPTGRFDSGVYTLDPNRPGPNVTINIVPAGFSHGIALAPASALSPGDMAMVARLGLPIDKGTRLAATFNQPTSCGPGRGYATPTYTEIAAEITFC